MCLAPECNMTKRDSSFADLDSPRNLRFDSWSQPMNPFRHRHASEAASTLQLLIPLQDKHFVCQAHLRHQDLTNPTPSIWLLVIGASHSNANCQSKLAPPRSIPASIRDVSTSPGPSYTYIQRSHYVPIRHSSAKIDDHGG